ncbi:MAG: hypothetical protein LBV12_08165, partial [Puniceicoccales bacterium]|nr:hypothetical protein [Puniceicoccales bacterium]
KFSQSARTLFWEKSANCPITRSELGSHHSNNHCIPATPEVRCELFAIQRHELATLEGYLVSVVGEKYSAHSSLVRFDTGAHACEILWVTHVTRENIGTGRIRNK